MIINGYYRHIFCTQCQHYNSNSKDFQTNVVTAFNCVNKWLKVNLLPINGDKTHYIHFETKNKLTLDINNVCNDNLITTVPKIKFLGIYRIQ